MVGLGLYLAEEIVPDEDIWVDIFKRARKKGKVVDAVVGQHNFQYALLNPKDNLGRIKRTIEGDGYYYPGFYSSRMIKDEEKKLSIGRNECGLSFVFERLLPRPDFADFVGLHEHTEANCRSDDEYLLTKDAYVRQIHGSACKTELEEVLKKDEYFVNAYASWVVFLENFGNKNFSYFSSAIPSFKQLTKRANLNSAEILREFKKQLDEGKHLNA